MAGLIKGKQLENATVGDTKLAVSYTKADGTRAFTGNQSMGNFKLTNMAAGVDPNDAVRKAQLDAAIAGTTWREAAAVLGYHGNYTIAGINGLTPSAGDAVVATDAGTPTAGSSDALVAGDLAEFDGTSWKKIVSASGGYPPAGTRAVVSTTATLGSPLTGSQDEGKIAEWDGTSLTPSLETTLDGWGIAIAGEGSVYENRSYLFDGSVPTGSWILFSGLQPTDAGAGLSKSGSVLNVGDANKGVQVNADDLEIDASESAGDGIEEDPGASHKFRVKLDGDSISRSASGIKAAVPTKGDKGRNPSATSGDNQTTGLTISATPSGDGMVLILVNGVQYEMGDGVKTKDCYFSVDAGATARAIGAIASGDTLYWNGAISGFDLETDDVMDFNYNVA